MAEPDAQVSVSVIKIEVIVSAIKLVHTDILLLRDASVLKLVLTDISLLQDCRT